MLKHLGGGGEDIVWRLRNENQAADVADGPIQFLEQEFRGRRTQIGCANLRRGYSPLDNTGSFTDLSGRFFSENSASLG
jgi:hypothetical protein